MVYRISLAVLGSCTAAGHTSKDAVRFSESSGCEEQSCCGTGRAPVAESQSPHTVNLQLQVSGVEQDSRESPSGSVCQDRTATELPNQDVSTEPAKAACRNDRDSP